MDRRHFAYILTTSLLGLTACDSQPNKVTMALNDLDHAVEQLESDVSDFDTMNWRDVVPEIGTDAENLSECVARLRNALGYGK